jgi:hypothetical protein
MDKENNILDDPTGIDNIEKDKSLLFILENIEQVYENADQWQYVCEEVRDITTKDIDEYIMALNYKQDLPIKNINVSSQPISDVLKLSEIYDYIQTYPKNTPTKYPQKVYFIEGDMSAITVIPVQTESNNTTVYMELLFDSPSFINELWRENSKRKGLGSIKFVNPKDLKPKKVVK